MPRNNVLLFGMAALLMFGSFGFSPASAATSGVKTETMKLPPGTYVGKFASIEFKADLSFSVTYEGQVVVKGKYTVKDNQVVLHDKTGPKACVGMDPGTYEWSLEGDKLSFLLLDDPCPGRRGMLKDATYVKK